MSAPTTPVLLLLKARVRAHTRRQRGKIVHVREYQNRVPPAMDAPSTTAYDRRQLDLFASPHRGDQHDGQDAPAGANRSDAAAVSDRAPDGPRPVGPVTADHGLPDATEPAGHAADAWQALAARGAIGLTAAAALRRRAAEGNWPEQFSADLADAISQLPPAMRAWIDQNPEGFRIVYRPNLDNVPPELHATYRASAGICVNHTRIEFVGDLGETADGAPRGMKPTPESLAHEMTHLAWYSLADPSRYGAIRGPAKQLIEEEINSLTKAGETMIAAALRRGEHALSTKRRPPEGTDPFDWAFAVNEAEGIRRDLKRVQSGQWLPADMLRAGLELTLAVGSDHPARLARVAGAPGFQRKPGEPDGALIDHGTCVRAIIAKYLGFAKRVNSAIAGAYAIEEPIAYRAGIDPDFADRLFATLTTPRPIEKAAAPILLLLKAVEVRGHMRGTIPVRPYVRREPFASWFAGSKAVDENGDPKVLFHGTGAGGFGAFDLGRASGGALYGPGLYFTDNPRIAGGTGNATTEDEVEAKARWGMAGYAFQGARYALTEPLSRQQMAHARRLFLGQQVARDIREDLGMAATLRAGWRALNDGPEAFAAWLANDGPRWMRDKLKATRQRITRPTVYPVHLAIRAPFRIEDPATPETVDRIAAILPPAARTRFLRNFDAFRQACDRARKPTTNQQVYDALLAMHADVTAGPEEVKPLATATLARAGFDGIRHAGHPIQGVAHSHEVWIAFRPNQVRSAISEERP